MKRNAHKIQDEASEGSDLHVVETPRMRGGVKTLPFPTASETPAVRPEIAVLGWEVRSYRLALRASKA